MLGQMILKQFWKANAFLIFADSVNTKSVGSGEGHWELLPHPLLFRPKPRIAGPRHQGVLRRDGAVVGALAPHHVVRVRIPDSASYVG